MTEAEAHALKTLQPGLNLLKLPSRKLTVEKSIKPGRKKLTFKGYCTRIWAANKYSSSIPLKFDTSSESIHEAEVKNFIESIGQKRLRQD